MSIEKLLKQSKPYMIILKFLCHRRIGYVLVKPSYTGYMFMSDGRILIASYHYGWNTLIDGVRFIIFAIMYRNIID